MVYGQESKDFEPLFDQLTENLKREYLNIGALLQTRGDFQFERNSSVNNGFSIANVRMVVSGELDKGFGYSLQASFIDSPAILDAQMYLQLSSALAVDIGLFKAPFSKERLTGAGTIDFVNRSQVVDALAPVREIGLQVRGWLKSSSVSFAAGIFNGNGFSGNNNDNNHFLYAGRLAYHSSPNSLENGLEFGFNMAVSEDLNVALTGLFDSFTGSRLLLGGDVRWSQSTILLSGEAIFSRLVPARGPTVNPYGWQATLGYRLSRKSQILFRWDAFNPDRLRANSNLFILGYNLWPTKVTEFQLNYIFPIEQGFDNQQVLINAQIAF